MKKYLALLIVALTSVLGNSKSFECAFLQERDNGGKPNKATCSMMPEDVLSTKFEKPRPSEHCIVKTPLAYEDLQDFTVDLKTGELSWMEVSILSKDLINYREPKKRGSSPAKESSKNTYSKPVSFTILSHTTSKQLITIDPLTQKFLEQPKEAQAHSIVFGDGYYLYIPEHSGHAILAKPSGTSSSSFIELRFGKCRVKGSF
ncbi:MAG: hypothetical protein HWE07_15695 [Cytophagia bacterium]|nr:hypothetical protein [Cytophagia bacterium]